MAQPRRRSRFAAKESPQGFHVCNTGRLIARSDITTRQANLLNAYAALYPPVQRSTKNGTHSARGVSNSWAKRWPAYTAAAIVLGARQSPIRVTLASPAVENSASRDINCPYNAS